MLGEGGINGSGHARAALTILEGMVGGLHCPSMLRVDGGRLFSSDGEEGSIKNAWVFRDEVGSASRKLEHYYQLW
jgi:hypothetical protein